MPRDAATSPPTAPCTMPNIHKCRPTPAIVSRVTYAARSSGCPLPPLAEHQRITLHRRPQERQQDSAAKAGTKTTARAGPHAYAHPAAPPASSHREPCGTHQRRQPHDRPGHVVHHAAVRRGGHCRGGEVLNAISAIHNAQPSPGGTPAYRRADLPRHHPLRSAPLDALPQHQCRSRPGVGHWPLTSWSGGAMFSADARVRQPVGASREQSVRSPGRGEDPLTEMAGSRLPTTVHRMAVNTDRNKPATRIPPCR